MPKRQSRYSNDDLMVPTTVTIPQGANPETITDVVQFQLVAGGLPPRAQPTEDGWIDGFWLYAQQQLMACCHCGPGTALVPTPGAWAVWIRVIDNPTQPVAAVDTLTVY